MTSTEACRSSYARRVSIFPQVARRSCEVALSPAALAGVCQLAAGATIGLAATHVHRSHTPGFRAGRNRARRTPPLPPSHWLEAIHHLVLAELVGQRAEAVGPERLLQRHVHLAAFGQRPEDPLGLLRGVGHDVDGGA